MKTLFGITPWKINGWNLQITHLERKMIWNKPYMIMFHVNLQGCIFSVVSPSKSGGPYLRNVWAPWVMVYVLELSPAWSVATLAVPWWWRVMVAYSILDRVMGVKEKGSPIHTVDGSEILLLTSWGFGSLSHCLQGFIHPKWCRISSINGKNPLNMMHLGNQTNFGHGIVAFWFKSRFTVYQRFFSEVDGMLQTQDDHQWAGNCQTLLWRVRSGSQFLGWLRCRLE